MPDLIHSGPRWSEDEKPSMPGSPGTLNHSMPVRLAYAGTSLLVGLTGGLGTALVSANLPNIQGHLGLTPTQGSWLPASYLLVNVSTNLLLIKFRQQYGMRRFAEIGLTIYLLLTLAHLFVEDFAMAVFVRAASGLAGAVVSTLALMYMLQAFRKPAMGKALIFGLGVSQLATPIAWLLSPALLDLGEWRTLYLFESGLTACSLAAVFVLKLPASDRIRAFEPLDFVTFALVAPGLGLLGAVLAQGRLQWWQEQAWMGHALVGATGLISIAAIIEYRRRNPLLQIRWLGTAATIRFALGAAAMRFILSEQTYGAVGLLQTLGMGPDQLQGLYGVMLLGLVGGIVTSALIFGQKTIIPQLLVSIVLIGWGSYLDSHATNLTRPHDMYVSQCMLSFAGGMFMGPLLLIGVMQALKHGPAFIVSFSVLFGMTQSLGGLAGPAVLGTIQVVREKFHSSQINEHLVAGNPVVAQRLQLQGQTYAGTQADPLLAQALGSSQLSQAATREANVLAFNDVFLLAAVVSMVFLGWSLFHTVRVAMQARRAARPGAPGGGVLATTTTASNP